MEEYFNAFVLAVIQQDGFTFLDCLTDVHGRKYIKLSDDKERKQKQLKEADFLCFCSVRAKVFSQHMELLSASKIDDFSDLSDLEIVNVCIETMRIALKKHYDTLYLPVLAHTLYLIRKANADEKIVLIKFLFSLIKPIDFTKCAVCGFPAVPRRKQYFNPISYRIECEVCFKGESFEVLPRTLKELENIYTCSYSNLHTLHITSSNYILFLLCEAMAHRYEPCGKLEKFLKPIDKF